MTRFVISTFSIGTMVLTSSAASGQNYPNKPIRVLTSTAGGGTDFTARIVAQGISGSLGQPVIVDNRGAVIGPEIVTKATPDGYTLLVSGTSLWLGPLMQKTSYDPIKDFAPIALLVNSPNILVVHPSVPAKSVKELIDLAKAKPGELNYASASIGSSNQLAAELFKSKAGVNLVLIPYKGTGQAVISVLGGETQLFFSTPASVAPYIKAGKLRALAVTSAKPSSLAPGLPAVAATVPGYEVGTQHAMFAPLGTPASIISRLNSEVIRLLNQAEVKEKFFNTGVETVASSPNELAAFLKADMVTWGKVIKDAGIRLD